MNLKQIGTRGVSLVELMVAVVIGMVLILAITQLMVRQEGIRRSVTGINDVAQSSTFVTAVLDREIRTAGSGLANSWNGLLGCELHVSRNGAQILPRATNFPEPFARVPQSIRGATLLIHAGAGPAGSGSDVIQILSGNAGIADVGFNAIAKSALADQVRLRNTLGIRGGDLVLISEPARNCMVQQVAAGFEGGTPDVLTFGGVYADDNINDLELADYSIRNTTNVALLGNTSTTPPRFLLFGHDADGAMLSHDLLNIAGDDQPTLLGEGVVMLRAVYGVDVNGDNIVDSWHAPSEAGYTAADLTSPAGQATLRRIFAVRVAMLIAGDLVEREPVSQETLTLFESLPSVTVERTLTENERRRRVRVYEFTVPLRNTVLATRRTL